MLFLTVCRSYISHCVSKCVMSFCLLNDYWLIDWWKSMEKGEIWPPPATQQPLTDGHQNLYRQLCRRYLPPCKTLSKSVYGFRFCACVISRPSAQSDSATFFGSCERLQPRRAHPFWHKIRQTTRFRARKCILGVAKPVSKVWTPIFPQNTPFRPNWIFFRQKTALTLDGSRVNDP